MHPPWPVIQEALGLLWTLWNPVQDLPQCPHGTVTGFNWHMPEKTLPAACEQPVSGGRLPWSRQVLSFGGLRGHFVPLPPVPCPFLPIHRLPASLHPRTGARQEQGPGKARGHQAQNSQISVNPKGNIASVGLTAVDLV